MTDFLKKNKYITLIHAIKRCTLTFKREKEGNMKRIILSFIAFVAMASAVMAQPKAGTFSVIPRIGVTLSKLSGDKLYVAQDFSLSSKYNPGMMVGADFEYQLTDIFALSVGAFYSQQGNKYDDYVEAHNLSTKNWSEMRDIKNHIDYINVPIMVSVFGAKNLAIKVGAQFGFNTHATTEMTTATFVRSEDGNASTESVKKSKSDIAVKKFDFSIPVGISYEYMNVILEARYNFGLTKVYQHLDDGKNSVISFTAGYRFKL